jgi:hypothetical protein
MKKSLMVAAFIAAAFASSASGAQAVTPKMHAARVMVGTVTDAKGTYMIVKMNGKTYGMLPQSDFDRVWAERNSLTNR